METIQFDYAGLEFRFVVLPDGRIRLGQYGRAGRLIDCKGLIEESKIVEIGAAGFDHEGHHGVKHSGSFFGERAVYVSHQIIENVHGKELIITSKDQTFQDRIHILIYKGCNVFSVYNEVENISSEPQWLEYVSSLFIFGFDEGEPGRRIRLSYANNGWHQEAQWNSFSFEELGIIPDGNNSGPKRWHLSNVGSWSSKEYLPMVSIEKESCNILAQVEANGSWDFEIGSAKDRRYLFSSGPNLTDSSWMKKLNPGDTFVSTRSSVSFGDDFEDALRGLTHARRLMRIDRRDNHELPVVFNSYMHALWDLQTEESLKPLIDDAAEVGAETFCIDAGWFAKDSQWWNAIGDWKEEPDNFPNGGLSATLDYIRSKRMKAGIWIEIENVGEESQLWKHSKPEWFLSIKGHPLFQHERHCLDFANEEVFSWAKRTIERLMGLYHLDYLKCDYNVDAGVGSDNEADSLGDGLLKNNRAILRFYDEIMEEFPLLTIENCASGGGRMDYETLKHFPIQSTSDQTDYRKYPYIAANVLTACPPDQAAVWSYPVDSSRIISDITDEDVAMNMVNSILGRIHLASFLNKLEPAQIDLVKEGVNAYKKTRGIKMRAWPIYPKGLALFGDQCVAGGIKDDETVILALWNTSGTPQSIEVDLKKYQIKELSVLYPTSLQTEYSFDSKSGKLVFFANYGYMGRAFIGHIK